MTDQTVLQHQAPNAEQGSTEIHILQWHDISVRIVWNPFHYAEHCGNLTIGHLQVTSEDGQPLPITETGYCSRFLARDHVARFGGALAFVMTWLGDAAAESEWQDYLTTRRQLSLF